MVDKGQSEQLLGMLSVCKNPVSFEIIATAMSICLQVVCSDPDALHVQSQLKAYFPESGQIDWSSFTPTIWLCVAFVVICVTFFAYLLNILALRQVHSSVVGAYIYLQPVVAAIISICLGKDHITTEKIISAALIFSGVYLVSFAGTKKVFDKPESEPDSDDMVME